MRTTGRTTGRATGSGRGRAPDGVEHGFPHLAAVRASVTALYRSVPREVVDTFGTSVLPVDVAFSDAEDLRHGAERIARVMVRQLRLPDARITVGFRAMDLAAHVELTEGPEYFVELNERFARHRRDIGAALAHEVTHVYLHRIGLSAPGTGENEILTDTVATYLGAGWLLLDAFRQDALTSQKLGYLTPEEYGYVLAKRATLFGEDPAVWFTSPQAYEAYVRGRALARKDAAQPPLAASGGWGRRRYARDRRAAVAALDAGAGAPRPGDAYDADPGGGTGPAADPRGDRGYTFESNSPLRVSFPCPTCHQRIRVPVRGRVRARCGLCRTVLDCDT